VDARHPPAIRGDDVRAVEVRVERQAHRILADPRLVRMRGSARRSTNFVTQLSIEQDQPVVTNCVIRDATPHLRWMYLDPKCLRNPRVSRRADKAEVGVASAQERVPAVSPPAGVFKGMSGRALRPEVIIWGLGATADAGEPPPCAPTD
jgi:hypothetical protein